MIDKEHMKTYTEMITILDGDGAIKKVEVGTSCLKLGRGGMQVSRRTAACGKVWEKTTEAD